VPHTRADYTASRPTGLPRRKGSVEQSALSTAVGLLDARFGAAGGASEDAVKSNPHGFAVSEQVLTDTLNRTNRALHAKRNCQTLAVHGVAFTEAIGCCWPRGMQTV